MKEVDTEIIIVGGGAAGLQAALMLGRQRRTVVLIESGDNRNAPAASIHMLPGQDGVAPAKFYKAAHRELGALETLSRLRGRVASMSVDASTDTVAVHLSGGRVITARRLLLATGQHDQLSGIAGLADLWGAGVYHCPYCHGWESRDRDIVVVQVPGMPPAKAHYQALYLAQRLARRVRVIADEFPEEQLRQALADKNVEVLRGAVTRLSGTPGAVTVAASLHPGGGAAGEAAGDAVTIDTELVYAMPPITPGLRDVPAGVETDGPWILTDAQQRTSLPQVFAAGDACKPRHCPVPEPSPFVAQALAQGQTAGLWIDQDLFLADALRPR